MLLISASMLTACGGSTLSAKVPLELNAPKRPVGCEEPVGIPDRDLSRAEVEKLWARDRVRLVACFGSEQAAWKYIEGLGQK